MATTSSSSRDGVHDVPDQAYQPSNFSFPRREFGKSAPVKRAFQASWLNCWKWLRYDFAHLLLLLTYCFKWRTNWKILKQTSTLHSTFELSWRIKKLEKLCRNMRNY